MSIMVENEVLECFRKVVPYLHILFDGSAAFGIADKNKYLFVENCEDLPMKIKAGDLIPQGGAIAEVLKTGKTLIKDVPKEVYGVPFKSYAIPIKNEHNSIVGVISVAKTLGKRNQVLALAETVASALEQMSSAIQNVSDGVQDVVNSNSEILDEVKVASESTKGTDDILKFVQGVSSQTNLLGLNAAIEASRVGDAGRGFSVIAKEIRKLSNSSSESVKQIDGVLRKIESSVTNISTKINESSIFFETQAAAFEEISASIQELSASAQELKNLSKIL